MFKAYDIINDSFVYSFDDIDYNNNLLFCPYCEYYFNECGGISFVKEHFKDGKKWSPHFRVNRKCKYKNKLPKPSERESFEHLNLKHDLFFYLKNLGYNCDIEVKIENHICDVVAVSKNNRQKLAIECQISYISKENVIDRNDCYKKNGYRILWVTRPLSPFSVGNYVKLNKAQNSIAKVTNKCFVYDLLHDGNVTKRMIWAVKGKFTDRGWGKIELLKEVL